MKSVIMAGGEGTRLRPLTANQPKPMLPLGNRPMMEHIVRHVHNHGFKDIVVTVQFLASQVRNYFGDGSDMGVDLTYATETTPLGTAGSVRNAAEQLDETFLVLSGDALTDVDLDEVVSFHRRSGAMVTVALKRMENPLEFGIVITREDGRIERFLEKPHWGQVFSDTINTGIYVIEPEVFDHIPDGASDFAGDIFPKLLARGAPLYGFVVYGYWEDVGNLEAYQQAHRDLLDGRVNVDVRGFQVRPGLWLGEGAEVDPDATLDGPVLIGDFAKVEGGASLREYTVIGSGVVVKSGAVLPGATVTKSIIWEGRGARSLFDEHGVSGLANVDMTPELVLRVAMAFGSTLKKGSRVTLGRDASRVSRALKRALVAGLTSTGVTCDDLELAAAPAVRFWSTQAGSSGGMYVRTSLRDSQSIELATFAADGCDLDETARRKVERTYNRQEFRRAFGRETGELHYPPRSVERYTGALLDCLDARAVRKRGFKVLLDAGGGTCTLVLPYLLPRLGLDSLIVNGQLDEARVALETEQERSDLERLARLVVASGADLGVRFDPVGERLTLVDERGIVLPFDRALLLYVDLVARSDEAGDIALPVSTTRLATELAVKQGRHVIGTKLAASAIARAAQREGVVFAGAEGGGYVFPRLHPAYDALLAFGKLLELLAAQETGLARAVADLPEPSLAQRDIPTSWERKGAVMRQVVEAAKERPVDDTDGIKIFHAPDAPGEGEAADWVLIVPDTVEPVTHLWAEAASAGAAKLLADEYQALIQRAAEGG